MHANADNQKMCPCQFHVWVMILRMSQRSALFSSKAMQRRGLQMLDVEVKPWVDCWQWRDWSFRLQVSAAKNAFKTGWYVEPGVMKPREIKSFYCPIKCPFLRLDWLEQLQIRNSSGLHTSLSPRCSNLMVNFFHHFLELETRPTNHSEDWNINPKNGSALFRPRSENHGSSQNRMKTQLRTVQDAPATPCHEWDWSRANDLKAGQLRHRFLTAAD